MTGQEWRDKVEAGHAEHTRETPASVTESCRLCWAVRDALRAAGRRGGLAGRGESKRRGDSAYYRALRRRDYVADRRQYLSDGRRNRTSGGWGVVRWDEERQIYIEPLGYYATKREALEALRQG